MEEIKFLLYSYLEDDVNVGVIVKNDTLWLTQKSMAELFGVGVPAISKHLKKIYESEELEKNTTISKMETVVNRGFIGEVKEEVEYDIFNKIQKIESDFDKQIENLKRGKK